MNYGFLVPMLSVLAAGAAQAGDTTEVVRESGGQNYWVEQLAHGFNYPSSMAWLPNGDILITERQGGLRIYRDDVLDPKPVRGIPASFQIGLNGLKEVLLDPDFATNHAIYLALSEGTIESNHAAIYRARYVHGELKDAQRIFRSKDDLFGAGAGCTRMMFLPDKTLLFGVPENNSYKARAQQLSSHIGKVVRINRDGSVPADNPFLKTPGALPEIWSYGHRETLGFYRDADSGDLWAVESGPKGGDELNLLKPGANYGWAKTSWGFDYTGILAAPLQSAPGIEEPVYLWVPSVTPSGIVRYQGTAYPQWNGDYFVGHLTTRQLQRMRIVGHRVVLQERLLTDLEERIRDVKVGSDGYLYLLTDSPDGRLLRLQPGRPDAAQLSRVAARVPEPLDPPPAAGAPLLPQDTTPGDPVLGKQAFLERCSACHSVGSTVLGGNQGPDLQGVYGRNVGGRAGFGYSEAMTGSPQIWDARSLNWFMANPARYLPGTKMAAPPLGDPEIRRRIVGFLLEQSSQSGDSSRPQHDAAAQTSLWDQDNLLAGSSPYPGMPPSAARKSARVCLRNSVSNAMHTIGVRPRFRHSMRRLKRSNAMGSSWWVGRCTARKIPPRN